MSNLMSKQSLEDDQTREDIKNVTGKGISRNELKRRKKELRRVQLEIDKATGEAQARRTVQKLKDLRKEIECLNYE